MEPYSPQRINKIALALGLVVALIGLSEASQLVPRFKFAIRGFYNDHFQNPSAIFIDRKEKELYVADNGRGEVMIFTLDGTPVFRFGRRKGLSAPKDLVVRDGSIYVVEEGKPHILIYNYRGELEKRLKPVEDEDFMPGNMEMDERGYLYITDIKNGGCLVLDREDKPVARIAQGLKPISSVAVGRRVIYFIAPFYRGRVIHLYTKEGKYLKSFEAIEGRGGSLGLPVAGRVDREDNLWLVDSLRGIIVYTQEGKRIMEFGGGPPLRELLEFPIDIDFSDDNVIYILEKGRKRISVFR